MYVCALVIALFTLTWSVACDGLDVALPAVGVEKVSTDAGNNEATYATLIGIAPARR
jgi:hypothetical protein